MTKTLETKVKKAVSKHIGIKNTNTINIDSVLECAEFDGAIIINVSHDNNKYEVITENNKILEVNTL